MRLFVSVPVPEELKERIALLAKELPEDGITAVKPQNMHLTLKFIGETPDTELETIKERLEKVRFGPLACQLKGVGVFPNESYIRVVWAGCESGGALEALAKEVMGALRGFGGDERFTAHLTIARVKKKLDLKGFLQKHRGDDFGSFEVGEFHLMQSVLKSGEPPEYNVLARYGAGKD